MHLIARYLAARRTGRSWSRERETGHTEMQTQTRAAGTHTAQLRPRRCHQSACTKTNRQVSEAERPTMV
eukprot:1691811-Rhodomonas_salina.1